MDWKLRRFFTKERQKSLLAVRQLFCAQNRRQCFEMYWTCVLATNTTSSLQPLDQGIIKSFKHHYRRLMLQNIVLTIDWNEDITAMEVSRSLSVLSAINFMSASWTAVSKETIENCFFNTTCFWWALSWLPTWGNSTGVHWESLGWIRTHRRWPWSSRHSNQQRTMRWSDPGPRRQWRSRWKLWCSCYHSAKKQRSAWRTGHNPSATKCSGNGHGQIFSSGTASAQQHIGKY